MIHFSSGVGGASVSNLASMDPRPSMASGQHGLRGQTAREPVEAESCTGNAPAPVRGNKRSSNFRWFSSSQFHCNSCHHFTVQMKKPFMGDCFNNPPPGSGQKEILESYTSQNSSFLNTWRRCLPGCCQHARAHARASARCERTPTHAPDSGSHPSAWQSRQTDYLSPCSRQGKSSNSMLFSLKAAKTVSKHPPLLLTHTNIILHNSADQDPTVHILSLAVGSVRAITPTGDIQSCYVGFQSWDPALLFSSLPVQHPHQWSLSFAIVLMEKNTKRLAPAGSSYYSRNNANVCIPIRICCG